MHIMRQLSKNYTNKYDAVNIELFYSNVLSHCVCVSRSVISDSLRPHGVQPTRLLCPWNSPGKNTGVGSHSLLQGIFPTQELNLGLLHCRQSLHCLSHLGSPNSIRRIEKILNRINKCLDCLIIQLTRRENHMNILVKC